MITSAHLSDALELLRDHWGIGEYYDPHTGCYCAAGAVARAVGDLDGENGYVQVSPDLEDELRGLLELDLDVYEWNDNSTHAEVIARFEAAIVRLSAES